MKSVCEDAFKLLSSFQSVDVFFTQTCVMTVVSMACSEVLL